jgi:cation diffusion facilitator family transporter
MTQPTAAQATPPPTEPDEAPADARHAQRVAKHAIIGGALITLLKFAVYWYTNSVAVFTDAMESIINIAAAGFVLYSLRMSLKPPDLNHPYGHGKIEFIARMVEGWLILTAAVVILYSAFGRFFDSGLINEANLGVGMIALGVVALLSAALAGYVFYSGWKHESRVLMDDGKHLAADVASTLAVILGLAAVKASGAAILDPIVAVLVAGVILFISWQILLQASRGLMDETDPQDVARICKVLDEEVAKDAIRGYHKIRLRHQGSYHWVDMHLQMDAKTTVEQAHRTATLIERRVIQALGRGNATAHVEPYDPKRAEQPPPDPADPHARPAETS